MTYEHLGDLLRAHRAQHGNQLAFRTLWRNWTYSQLDEESNRIAQGLLSLGIKAGDRVAALTKHTDECVILLLGACKIGAVCMPVNWRLAAPELEFIFSNGEAKFLMCDHAFWQTAHATEYAKRMHCLRTEADTNAIGAANNIGGGGESFPQWRTKFAALDPALPARSSDTAVQLYSSGTTGLPKGVELTHANLLACFAALTSGLGMNAQSVMLNTLPTFHISGIGLALLTVYQGSVTVLNPEFDPKWILPAFGEYRISHVLFVPAMILALLNTEGVDRADYSALKSISYGASPITDQVLISAMRTFKCDFVQVYGLTETTGAITYLSADDHDPDGPKKHLLRAAGSAGAGVGLRIVDAATGRDCAEGEVGEVWIRSQQNMAGYWRNPKATSDAFPEGRDSQGGWFRSGDAGYMREGYLFIHDRIKDMIISGGENIYPAEVENMLMQYPAIADCAVIGVPDDKWGEAVKACVVLRGTGSSGVTEAQIIAFSRERMAHFKCPKSVDFFDALPRNPSGKLLKYVMRKPYWEGRDRQVN